MPLRGVARGAHPGYVGGPPPGGYGPGHGHVPVPGYAPGAAAEEPSVRAGGRAGLSPVKVTGQALAAVTTAGVGAVLGGAGGTVVGAAFASVVTTVGEAFYQHSLKRTSERVKSLGSRSGDVPATPGVPATAMTAVASSSARPPGGGAASGSAWPEVRRDDDGRTRVVPLAASAGGGAHTPPPEPDDEPTVSLPLPDLATSVAPGPTGPDGQPPQVTPAATRVAPAAAGTRMFSAVTVGPTSRGAAWSKRSNARPRQLCMIAGYSWNASPHSAIR